MNEASIAKFLGSCSFVSNEGLEFDGIVLPKEIEVVVEDSETGTSIAYRFVLLSHDNVTPLLTQGSMNVRQSPVYVSKTELSCLQVSLLYFTCWDPARMKNLLEGRIAPNLLEFEETYGPNALAVIQEYVSKKNNLFCFVDHDVVGNCIVEFARRTGVQCRIPTLSESLHLSGGHDQLWWREENSGMQIPLLTNSELGFVGLVSQVGQLSGRPVSPAGFEGAGYGLPEISYASDAERIALNKQGYVVSPYTFFSLGIWPDGWGAVLHENQNDFDYIVRNRQIVGCNHIGSLESLVGMRIVIDLMYDTQGAGE